MPFPNLRLSLRRTACALAGAAVMVFTVPAVAGACTLNTAGEAKVFAAFHDQSDYVLTPGGSFMGGAAGWTLSGASVVSPGAGLFAGDSRSLRISGGGSATSPAFCVATSTPTVRFMVRESGALVGLMNAYLLWKDWAGRTRKTYAGWVGGTLVWTPSIPLMVNALPMWEPGRTLTVRLELAPRFGSWYVDDVYEDPYTRG